jgi:excisionase family DNA binding protein
VINSQPAGRLLTVEAAADRMSTSVRFIRRLIAERRIEFMKVGRTYASARRLSPSSSIRAGSSP